MSRKGSWLSLALLLGAAAGYLPAQTQKVSIDLRSSAYCSTEKPGTPLIELSWIVPATALDSALRDQRIDATVYFGGFDLGRYVSLTPIAAEQPFQYLANKVPANELPHALKLRVAAVQSVRSLAQNRVLVQLEDVDSGVDYTFRLTRRSGDNWITLATTGARAPVCPIDNAERER